MPGVTTADLTPLWQREISLRGAYAYHRHDFDTAIELVAERDLGRLLTATYPLRSYEDAIAHAPSAGSRGAVKIAFDLTSARDVGRASSREQVGQSVYTRVAAVEYQKK